MTWLCWVWLDGVYDDVDGGNEWHLVPGGYVAAVCVRLISVEVRRGGGRSAVAGTVADVSSSSQHRIGAL